MKAKLYIQEGIYRHYKGNLYEVLDIARHSEDLEEMVVHKTLYDDFGLWIRPLKMLLGEVEINGAIHRKILKVAQSLH